MSLRDRLIGLGGGGVVLTTALFLGPVEAPVLHPYDDIGGVKTWCYGETLGTPKARYTAQECEASLLAATQRHWDGIRDDVPSDAPESVKAGMLSVAYNVGIKGWRHQLFTRPLSVGDWRAACEAIRAPWKGKHGVAKGFKATVGGKPSKGLENRRAKEYALCVKDL